MWKRIISITFLLCLFSTTAFAHTATVQTGGESKYKAVRLTPEIYNAANSDLSDLLLKDSKGENVPYFINSGFHTDREGRETYPMELINSYTKDNSFYFDYKIAAAMERDTAATSIEVATESMNFAKAVDVYGSYDNLNWDFVQNDKLYIIDDKSKLIIELNKPQKYTYYRFKLSNNLEKISFNAVNLIYSTKVSEKNYFIESLIPTFHIEEKDKTTFIKIDGLKNLRLYDVTIDTDSMFKRIVSAPLGSEKEIYNLSLNGISYNDTALPLDRQISQDETFVITIVNNDDKPINIKGVTVCYYADEMVFEGKAGESYTIDFGADATKTAPVYDIERYKDEILKGKIDEASISAISYDSEKEKPSEVDSKVIFNIVVIGIAVLLGGLILFHLRRNKNSI